MKPAPLSGARRRFLNGSTGLAGALALGAASSGAAHAASSRDRLPHVVVIGAGFGGATVARFLRTWGGDAVRVTLVERESAFVSCPLSNLVLSGDRDLNSLTRSREPLRGLGVQLVQDTATAVDPERRRVRLAHGEDLTYDRLVIAPGIDFLYDGIEGMGTVAAREAIVHAWKAGPQTATLRAQLESMPNGGTFVMTIPLAPYRCPPGPYERACTVASFFQRSRMKSKLLILDANDEVTSKKDLFTKVWKDQYPGIVEYRPQSALRGVDVATRTARLEFDDVRADVLNVIPPQRAADIALRAGLVNVNGRWCGVDWRTMESTAVPGIHVLGDACMAASAMPKSAFMANQHAKTAAAALLAVFDQNMDRKTSGPSPSMVNTCYSFVDPVKAMHIASVHRWDASARTMVPVPGAGGLSARPTPAEGEIALAVMQNLWAEAVG